MILLLACLAQVLLVVLTRLDQNRIDDDAYMFVRYARNLLQYGSVFLNTDYEAYLLTDINPDLIRFYNLLKYKPDQLILDARRLFAEEYNQSQEYYALRERFNATQDEYQRALMFLYLNRHGYNGLCRYNRKGGFNVPFGRYKRPHFPEAELWA